MQLRKLAVGIVEFEFDRPLGLRPAAAHFGERVFEPVGQIDPAAILLSCHGIDDRLATLIDIAGYLCMGTAAVDIDLHVDVGEQRRMDLGEGRGEHIEDRRSRLCVLSAQDAEYGVALGVTRALFYYREGFAIAVVDRSRPSEDARETKPIKFGVT